MYINQKEQQTGDDSEWEIKSVQKNAVFAKKKR
jgi:hypothetical protein